MSTATETGTEMYRSLNGYEELAIRKEFGSPIHELATSDPSTFARALVMIHVHRQSPNIREAFKAAMELPVVAVNEEYFAAADEGEADDLGEASASDLTSST